MLQKVTWSATPAHIWVESQRQHTAAPDGQQENNKDRPVERRENGRAKEEDQRQKTGAGGEMKTPHLCSSCSPQLNSEPQGSKETRSVLGRTLVFILEKIRNKGAKMCVGKLTPKDTNPKQSSDQLHGP